MIVRVHGFPAKPGWKKQSAFKLAQKAIGLDQASFIPHGTLGWFYLLQGKQDEAVVEGEKAVALVPNSAFANFQLGAFLTYADRPAEVISVSQNALRLNPFPKHWQLWFLGNAYGYVDRYEEALTYFKKAQKCNPDITYGPIWLRRAFMAY